MFSSTIVPPSIVSKTIVDTQDKSETDQSETDQSETDQSETDQSNKKSETEEQKRDYKSETEDQSNNDQDQSETEEQSESDDSYNSEESVDEPDEWPEVAPLYPSVPTTSCHLFYVFVGLDKNIQEVQQEVVSLEKDSSELSFNTLHTYLRKRSGSRAGSQYKLLDTLVFNLDIEHDEILPFLNSNHLEDIVANHLHVMPFLNDVNFHPSPIELHSANTIYFILMEKETVRKTKLNLAPTDSSMRQDDILDVAYNRTKRQYVSLGAKPPIQLRKTRKVRPTL